MTVLEKDSKIIRKQFGSPKTTEPEKIRLGNSFADDFLFEGAEAADIPINALRVIFNIVSIIGSEQFRPQDRPKQLSLFEDEFETENNIFVSLKIPNHKISPSGSTKQVVDAYEFLARFKMGWYKSTNRQGKEIKTFGGLISTPAYDQRGYTRFLISSYWLKKLLVIPEYNYVLYNLVYHIRNNKHILLAIWLTKLPKEGVRLKLSTLNKKFGLNYRTANDFCSKFLKPAKLKFNQYNDRTFLYHYKGDFITIIPFANPNPMAEKSIEISQDKKSVNRRLLYFRKRYRLKTEEMQRFSYQYQNIAQTRELIEKAFKRFVRTSRQNNIRSTEWQGKAFLEQMQGFIIEIYGETKMGQLLPNGYPVIV